MAKKCYYCTQKNQRFIEDGIAFHSYKLSNGYEYDNYTSPCENQTKEGMATLRKGALSELKSLIQHAKDTLSILQAHAATVRKTKTPSSITVNLERAKML